MDNKLLKQLELKSTEELKELYNSENKNLLSEDVIEIIEIILCGRGVLDPSTLNENIIEQPNKDPMTINMDSDSKNNDNTYKNACSICSQKLTFRNSFEDNGQKICKECLSKKYLSPKPEIDKNSSHEDAQNNEFSKENEKEDDNIASIERTTSPETKEFLKKNKNKRRISFITVLKLIIYISLGIWIITCIANDIEEGKLPYGHYSYHTNVMGINFTGGFEIEKDGTFYWNTYSENMSNQSGSGTWKLVNAHTIQLKFSDGTLKRIHLLDDNLRFTYNGQEYHK